MPKRWRVVSGASYTWQYVDTDNGKVLARTSESWESRRAVREEIQDMKRNDDIEEDED
jgi:hypothetical protein